MFVCLETFPRWPFTCLCLGVPSIAEAPDLVLNQGRE